MLIGRVHQAPNRFLSFSLWLKGATILFHRLVSPGKWWRGLEKSFMSSCQRVEGGTSWKLRSLASESLMVAEQLPVCAGNSPSPHTVRRGCPRTLPAHGSCPGPADSGVLRPLGLAEDEAHSPCPPSSPPPSVGCVKRMSRFSVVQTVPCRCPLQEAFWKPQNDSEPEALFPLLTASCSLQLGAGAGGALPVGICLCGTEPSRRGTGWWQEVSSYGKCIRPPLGAKAGGFTQLPQGKGNLGEDIAFRELLGMQDRAIRGAPTLELHEMEKEPTSPRHSSIQQAGNSQLLSGSHRILSTVLTLPTFSLFLCMFLPLSLVLSTPSSPPPPSEPPGLP